MARQTAAQKKAYMEAYNLEAAAAEADYKLRLPGLLLDLVAKSIGRHDVNLDMFKSKEQSLRLQFTFETNKGSAADSTEVLGLDSGQWELDIVAARFVVLEEQDKEDERIRQIALVGYEKLTPEERVALGILEFRLRAPIT